MRALLLAWLLFAPLVALGQHSPEPRLVETRADSDPPGVWQRMRIWQVDPQHRLIWIRMKFVLPESVRNSGELLAVHVAAPAASEAWWNGVHIGRNGIPGASPELEQPGTIDYDFPIPASALKGENELLIRMSSFHLPLRLGYPIQFIDLMPFGALPAEWLRRNAFRMAAVGALLLGAVYFGALFLSNRCERSSLWLALLSLAVLGQLLSESARFFVNYSYPLHVLRLDLILGFAAASGFLLVGYVTSRFAPDKQTGLLAITLGLAVASAALVPGFDGKTIATMWAAFIVAGIAAAMGMRAKARGSVIALTALGAALALAAADAGRFIDQGYYLAIVALLLLLFSQQVGALRSAQREREEARVRTARLELQLLKHQIQPHFLMNTLTALSEWIESDPATGVKMIEALADEMRAISAMSGAARVPLRQELDLCRHYLRVMGFRRNQDFTLAAEGVDLEASVPPAIFHTLIENAFTHSQQPGGAIFTLSEERGPEGMRLYRFRAPLQKGAGISRARGGKGHAYVRGRLSEAYGEKWRFISGPSGSGEWIDSIELPVA